jgi:uncharacterized membrane protein YbhN (UPF0104 family)
MLFIAFLLIGTVILAYVVALLERYGHFLLVLTGEILLGVLALVVLVLVARAVWSWFCHWWELRQIRIQATNAIRRTSAHYEKSRAEMEQVARLYQLRNGDIDHSSTQLSPVNREVEHQPHVRRR